MWIGHSGVDREAKVERVQMKPSAYAGSSPRDRVEYVRKKRIQPGESSRRPLRGGERQ